MKVKACFALSLFCLAFGTFALEPGDQAPEIATSKFLAGEPFKLSDAKGKGPCLVEFFASWSDDGISALRTLSQFKRDFAKDGLQVLAISAEEEKDVLPKLPKASLCPVALDDKGASEAAYMSSEPVLPTFFLIDKDGVLVWKGQSADLAFVLKRFLDGKFKVDDAKRVASFRKTVSEALAAKSLNKAIDASDELLRILPADNDTVKLRLAMYEMQGNRRQSLDFLDNLIERAPDAENLYFSKLEIMLHSEPKSKPADIALFATKACEAFKKNPEALNNLAWILLDETDFGNAPLETACKASKASFAQLPADADSDLRAACIDTLARVYYSIGRIDKAIELQSQALELWKGTDDEERCKNILEFYKTARSLVGE